MLFNNLNLQLYIYIVQLKTWSYIGEKIDLYAYTCWNKYIVTMNFLSKLYACV